MGDPTSSSAADQGKRASVLFVCLGNICRSPMAEGAFRNLTAFNTPSAHPLIAEVDSCGTGAYHAGDHPDPRTMSVLTQHKIQGYEHFARRVRVPEDFKEFDYILGMDRDNVEDLRDMARRAVKKGSLTKEEGEEAQRRIHLYGEFGAKGSGRPEEVDDPYYGGRNGFEIAYEQLTRFGKGLLETIERESGRSVE